MSEATLRESALADRPALEALYPAAFPEENLLPLLRDLLAETEGVLSLVALREGALVGHIAFTCCGVESAEERVALLGPLAVAPPAQRQGIGGALIRAGCERLSEAGFAAVMVLGDPAYYSRFGFAADPALAPPYPLPEAWRGAWRMKALRGGPAPAGRIQLPPLWRKPALWAP